MFDYANVLYLCGSVVEVSESTHLISALSLPKTSSAWIRLALTGAAIGSGIAWFLHNGTEDLYGTNYFRLVVTPASMATGMIWTMVIALLGGLLPSIRAARSPIVAGLRAV